MLLCASYAKLIILHIPSVFRTLPLHMLFPQLGMSLLPFSNWQTQSSLRTVKPFLTFSLQGRCGPLTGTSIWCPGLSLLFPPVLWLAVLHLHLPLDCELLEGGVVDCDLLMFVSPEPTSINVEWNSCHLLIVHHIPGYIICIIFNPSNNPLRSVFILIFTGKETAQELSQWGVKSGFKPRTSWLQTVWYFQ